MLHTRESIEHGLRSYRAAMEKVFEISPVVDTTGSGSWNNLGLPENVRCIRSGDVSNATGVDVAIDSLFDFGRPKLIEKSYWTWRESYFRVTVFADFPYTKAEWQGERVSIAEDGEVSERFPAALRESHPQRIRLELRSRSWGLGDWDARLPEIRSFLDGAPEEVRAKYAKAVEDADAQATKWRDAIRSVAAGVA